MDVGMMEDYVGKFKFKDILLDYMYIPNGNGSAGEFLGDASVRKIIDKLDCNRTKQVAFVVQS